MTRNFTYLLISTAILTFTACSGNENDAGSPKESGVTEASKELRGTQSNIINSDDVRGKCKRITETDVRDPESPVVDILGIRPGMKADDAYSLLLCRDNIVDIGQDNSFYSNMPRKIETRHVIRASSGKSCSPSFNSNSFNRRKNWKDCDSLGNAENNWFSGRDDIIQIAVAGSVESQDVGAIWRSRHFAESEKTLSDTIASGLVAKYGEPHDRSDGRSSKQMYWIYDLRGRPMSTSHPSYRSCKGGPEADYTSSQSWNSACGQTVIASLQASRTNPEILDAFHVVSMDQAGLYEGMQVMAKDIEDEFKRRQKEDIEKVKKSEEKVDF